MRANVGEIAIDQARRRDDVADALHGLPQNIVGDAERLEEAGALGNQVQQLIVGNRDHCIDDARQLGKPVIGLLAALGSFERERLGDHGDRQRAQFLRQRRDHGRGSGAGAAAEPRRDEHHVGAFQQIDDLFGVFERGLPADLRIRARAQAVGELRADRQLIGHRRRRQRLHVGVQHAELDAGESFVQHARDRILAAAADAEDANLGLGRDFFFNHEFQSIECHNVLLFVTATSRPNPSTPAIRRRGG